MKPRNFPGRKYARRECVKARAEGRPEQRTLPEVADIRVRLGRARRDLITGRGI